MKIKTYPQMNETIKDLLRRSEEPMKLYILARIEDLEKQVKDLTPPPNGPLTLEELREMDGEPVWDSILSVYGFVNVRSFNGKGCIRYVDNWTNPRCLVPSRYYRCRPKEGTV